MKYTITILFCFVTGLLFSQSTPLSQMKDSNEDLAYLQKILYLNHPNTFLYTSKNSLDSLFRTLQFTQNDQVTNLALEKRIRIILSAIGCIHTTITKPVPYNTKSVVPFDIFTDGTEIWIKQIWADSLKHLVGSQLLSINKNASKAILNQMKDFFAADGYNQTFKLRALNSKGRFRLLYNYYFDTDSLKTITMLTPNLDTIQQIIKSIPFKKNIKKAAKGIKFGRYTSLQLDTIHQVATIRISSFNLKGSYRKQDRRYKKIIRQIQDEDIKNVVIDLRDNLGGDATNANLFLSHFIHTSHRIDKERMKNKSFKYSITSSKLASSLDFLFKFLPRKKIRTDSSFIMNRTISKNSKSHFDGNLFVLVNGFSASASSNVASILKVNSQAIIIGQETGGAEEQFNAFFSPRYKLPNSKIQLKIPKYRIHLHATQNKGSGVLPTHRTKYSIQDVIDQKDLEYQQVIQLTQQRE